MMRGSLSHYSLSQLIEEAQKGSLRVPDFQRDFVWKVDQIRELLVSLLRGHFAGTFLLLEVEPPGPFPHELVYGVEENSPCDGSENGPKKKPSLPTTFKSILDGQQRISSVYYAFRHPEIEPSGYKDRYFFFLDLEKLLSGDIDEAVKAAKDGSGDYKDLFKKWHKGQAIPFGCLPKYPRDQQCELITLYDLLSKGQQCKCLQNYLEHTGSPYKSEGTSLCDKLRPLLDYTFHAWVLPSSTLLSEIVHIFVKINSTGTSLTLFDLAVATLYPILSPSFNLRDDLETALGIHYSEWNKLDTDILRVLTLLTGGGVKKEDGILVHLKTVAQDLSRGIPVGAKIVGHSCGFSFSSWGDLWNEATDCLDEAYQRILNHYGAPTLVPKWVPYTSMTVPLAVLLFIKRVLTGKGKTHLDEKIDCWYWHSVFYERYDKSVNSTTESDLKEMFEWMDKGIKPAWIVGSPPSLSLKDVKNRQHALFKAVLNLILKKGAKNLLSGMPPARADLEIDHLYPKKSTVWSRHPYIESVLNSTLLDKEVNKIKSSKDPQDFYIFDILPGHGGNPSSVRATFESHLIGATAESIFSKSSSKSSTALKDFEDFIEERERDVLNEIGNLLHICSDVGRGDEGPESERSETNP